MKFYLKDIGEKITSLFKIYILANKNRINIIISFKAETKFSVSVCESVSVHVHTQTKISTVSKIGRNILEIVFEKTLKRFF